MIDVATMLVVAAAFWTAHGYPVTQPITWEWSTPALEQEWHVTPGFQAYVPIRLVGGQRIWQPRIVMARSWWDKATRRDKCVVMIHELGHAAFGFEHEAGTVMAPVDDVSRPVPGTCIRSSRGWAVLHG